MIRLSASLKKLVDSGGWCDRDYLPCVECYFFIESQCSVIPLSREQVAELARNLLDKTISDIVEKQEEV